ncbi:MAG: hypothetical protein RBJ76_16555 [Stenomitos frigidus ULC029]
MKLPFLYFLLSFTKKRYHKLDVRSMAQSLEKQAEAIAPQTDP